MTDTDVLKRLGDIDLKALGDGFAKVLSENIGGTFTATVIKIEQTTPNNFGNKLLINFLVKDESEFERYSQLEGLNISL